MKKYENYEKTAAFTGEFETMTPGGYVAKILKVDSEEKNYGTLLRIGFDIAEGEKKDFFKKRFDQDKETNADAKWKGMYYQTVKESDLKFFKGFITAIEKSNNGYTWNWDEQTLVGKLIGFIFSEEEYEHSNGGIRISCKPTRVRSVEEIKKGVQVPPIKRLPVDSSGWDAIVAQSNTDLPF